MGARPRSGGFRRVLRRLQGRAQLAAVRAAGALSARLVRGEPPRVDPSVVLETWDAVADRAHNSNTDLIYWQGAFYLCHQTSPYHLGSSRSRLMLWRSADARSWEKVTEFKAERGEYRDPKFAAIGDRLFLYALPNLTRLAEPVGTVCTTSADGATWGAPQEIEPKGWLFWRPKTRDGETWYVTAYWHEHGRSQLLKSADGLAWETVSRIWEGDRNDETDFEFLPDGRIIATARLECGDGLVGDRRACTLIAVSSPPYREWTYERSGITRLDGPCLFPYNGRVYAVGRYQASFFPRLLEQGGLFSRKRTSIFLVEPDRLTRLTDLPSAGDTSYAGVVMQEDDLYVSYYTSRVEVDPVWIQGMFRPSSIRMARVSLAGMERLGERVRVPA